jgi:cytoskeletal protein CcmA (bactofilin family)
MAKGNEIEAPNINIFSTGTSVKGDIKSNGDIRIDGTLIGSVNSKGKVVIGATGNIEGEIICQNADFSGVVKAKIIVTELLQLKATAKITGDIITNKLSIEPGAKFSGTCNMDGNPGSISNIGLKEPVKETKAYERNEATKQKEPVL